MTRLTASELDEIRAWLANTRSGSPRVPDRLMAEVDALIRERDLYRDRVTTVYDEVAAVLQPVLGEYDPEDGRDEGLAAAVQRALNQVADAAVIRAGQLADDVGCVVRKLGQLRDATVTLACHDDGDWSAAIMYGREADDSPMIGAAAYGAAATAGEALRMALDQTGWRRPGEHVPWQIGTRDSDGNRTFTTPGDVCSTCSDAESGRWVPISQCPSAWRVAVAAGWPGYGQARTGVPVPVIGCTVDHGDGPCTCTPLDTTPEQIAAHVLEDPLSKLSALQEGARQAGFDLSDAATTRCEHGVPSTGGCPHCGVPVSDVCGRCRTAIAYCPTGRHE